MQKGWSVGCTTGRSARFTCWRWSCSSAGGIQANSRTTSVTCAGGVPLCEHASCVARQHAGAIRSCLQRQTLECWVRIVSHKGDGTGDMAQDCTREVLPGAGCRRRCDHHLGGSGQRPALFRLQPQNRVRRGGVRGRVTYRPRYPAVAVPLGMLRYLVGREARRLARVRTCRRDRQERRPGRRMSRCCAADTDPRFDPSGRIRRCSS